MAKTMGGTGELRPFKKSSTGSTCIGGSTNREHVREGFTENVRITRVSREEDKLEPFKVGSKSPGRNVGQESVPKFKEREGALPNPHGYKAFRK